MLKLSRLTALFGVVALSGCGLGSEQAVVTATAQPSVVDWGSPGVTASTSSTAPATTAASSPATTPSTAAVPATPSPSATTTPTSPAFRSDIRELGEDDRQKMVGVAWRQGCPTGLDELRRVELSYWNFDGAVQQGALVVRAEAATDVVAVFGQLFEEKFPIRRMEPIEAFGGDDFASIEADNTSAFNCRDATGKKGVWSKHAYGLAIDLNPLENPYVTNGGTSHPASRQYLDRSNPAPGVLTAGSTAVVQFEARGWGWGGRWNNPIDYQHLDRKP